MSYLDKYNSRQSKEKRRSISSKRQGSYDSNISFNKRTGSGKRDKSRSIGQSSKKSSSRSKNAKHSHKKLNPVRPPARRKSINRDSASKYGNSNRRKSKDYGGSNYNSHLGGRPKNHKGPYYQEK